MAEAAAIHSATLL